MRNSCSTVFIMATHSILHPRVAYFPPGKINILQCIYFESSSNQATMSILHSFRQTLTCCVWGLVYQKTDVSSGGKKKNIHPSSGPSVLLGSSTDCILSTHINKGGSSLDRQIQMLTSFGNPLRNSFQENVWPSNTWCSQADTKNSH